MRGEYVELALEHALITQDPEWRKLVPEHFMCAIPVPLAHEMAELRMGLPIVACTNGLEGKEWKDYGRQRNEAEHMVERQTHGGATK